MDGSSAAHLAGHVEAKASSYDGGSDLCPWGWGEQITHKHTTPNKYVT